MFPTKWKLRGRWIFVTNINQNVKLLPQFRLPSRSALIHNGHRLTADNCPQSWALCNYDCPLQISTSILRNRQYYHRFSHEHALGRPSNHTSMDCHNHRSYQFVSSHDFFLSHCQSVPFYFVIFFAINRLGSKWITLKHEMCMVKDPTLHLKYRLIRIVILSAVTRNIAKNFLRIDSLFCDCWKNQCSQLVVYDHV